MPRISVVIPTCHRNDWLARCLDRLRPGEQTLPAEQYEVIVTDDGSASTAQTMVGERYPWVKWTAGPHKGPAANRNHGASLAGGEWIAFTDDDCIPSPGWIAGYAAAAGADHPILEGKTVCKLGLPNVLYRSPVNVTGGFLWGCNLMVQAEFFRKIQGFNEEFPFWCEDLEFFDRVQRNGVKPLFVPDAEVDHPPRRRVLGMPAARAWESRVHLESAIGRSTTGNRPLPVHVLQIATMEALRKKWCWGSLLLLGSGWLETAYVLLHIRKWRKKYPLRAL